MKYFETTHSEYSAVLYAKDEQDAAEGYNKLVADDTPAFKEITKTDARNAYLASWMNLWGADQLLEDAAEEFDEIHERGTRCLILADAALLS